MSLCRSIKLTVKIQKMVLNKRLIYLLTSLLIRRRRHFSTELTSECRVRLIFNGRVLSDEAATLRACGLHDRAVVHCLVHPSRPSNQVSALPRILVLPQTAASNQVSVLPRVLATPSDHMSTLSRILVIPHALVTRWVHFLGF